MKTRYTVESADGYVKVYHFKRGLIAAGVVRNGRVTDIHVEEQYRKINIIRMSAMMALQNWERAQVA